MEILKENEEYLDKVALEILSKYFEKGLPQSDSERLIVSVSAYKQALTMLQAKLNLQDILDKSPYLNKHKTKTTKEEKD